MKKRTCTRFHVPGATLTYKNKPAFLKKESYLPDNCPVLDLSPGGAKFLCSQRLEPGKDIVIKLNVPETDKEYEILATIRWISKNPEQSYRYQTGVSFRAYGSRKNNNPVQILSFLKELETRSFI